jgi:imidazolonepropionase-like amidohydrolase
MKTLRQPSSSARTEETVIPGALRRLAVAMLAVGASLASAAAQPIVIQNARVHTMGPAGVIENGDVVMNEGRLVAIGPDLQVPPGATVIDAAGRVVTPGIFAPFAEIGLVEYGLDGEADDTSADDDFPLSAALDAVDAFNPNSTLIAINRAGGVTRALSAPQPGGKLFGGRAAVVDLSGRIASVTVPQAAQTAYMGYAGAAREGDSRLGAWAILREYLTEARVYAINPRDYKARARDNDMTYADLEALGAVVAGRQPLIVAVNSAVELRNLIRLKTEFNLNVIALGGAEAWRVARELAATNIPVILDPVLNLPSSYESLGSTLANAARLHAAGVKIAFFNSDAPAHNARLAPQLAGNAVAAGLPYEAALAALTINPATMYGVGDRLGSLEAGKLADVVIWDGDPLEVTTRAVAVFIDGRAMSMQNRQTRLRDRYRDLTRSDLPFAYRGEE